MPCVVVATRDFEDLALRLARLEGFDSRMLVVAHPLGGIADATVETRGRQAAETLMAMLQSGR